MFQTQSTRIGNKIELYSFAYFPQFNGRDDAFNTFQYAVKFKVNFQTVLRTSCINKWEDIDMWSMYVVRHFRKEKDGSINIL